MVFTTFVQFLNTLFDGSTSSVRRFHSLKDSVILIDEIQSLPVSMIHMFNMAMNYLSRMCRATVILCSATQPVLERVRLPIQMSQPADIIADADVLQLCAQAICLEEMLLCRIPKGFLYYGETKRRQAVLIDEELRKKSENSLSEYA